MTTPCPFCQPTLQRGVFYRAEGCWGVVNIAPIVPGHSLVLPRRHVARLLDFASAEYDALWRTVRQVTRLLLAAYNAPAVDISLQDGAAAGQTVAHVHVHVIPRRPGDLATPGGWYAALIDSTQRPRMTPEELDAQAAFLRREGERLGL